MKRNIIFLGVILIIAAFIVGVYQYNKPHRNIMKESAEFTLSADEIYNEFTSDFTKASTKYADKVVAFSGVIASVSKNQAGGYNILLKGKQGVINCEVDPSANIDESQLKENSEIQLKGLFIGFDDLLEELQFKKCSIVG